MESSSPGHIPTEGNVADQETAERAARHSDGESDPGKYESAMDAVVDKMTDVLGDALGMESEPFEQPGYGYEDDADYGDGMLDDDLYGEVEAPPEQTDSPTDYDKTEGHDTGPENYDNDGTDENPDAMTSTLGSRLGSSPDTDGADYDAKPASEDHEDPAADPYAETDYDDSPADPYAKADPYGKDNNEDASADPYAKEADPYANEGEGEPTTYTNEADTEAYERAEPYEKSDAYEDSPQADDDTPDDYRSDTEARADDDRPDDYRSGTDARAEDSSTYDSALPADEYPPAGKTDDYLEAETYEGASVADGYEHLADVADEQRYIADAPTPDERYIADKPEADTQQANYDPYAEEVETIDPIESETTTYGYEDKDDYGDDDLDTAHERTEDYKADEHQGTESYENDPTAGDYKADDYKAEADGYRADDYEAPETYEQEAPTADAAYGKGSHEQSVDEAATSSDYGNGYEAPAREDAAYETPVEESYAAPTHEEDGYEQPAYEEAPVEPTHEEPTYEEPAYEEPTADMDGGMADGMDGSDDMMIDG